MIRTIKSLYDKARVSVRNYQEVSADSTQPRGGGAGENEMED